MTRNKGRLGGQGRQGRPGGQGGRGRRIPGAPAHAWLSLLLIPCLLALGTTLLSQQLQPQRPTFSTSVNLTMVDLRVEDLNGRFIRDLTAGDFEVFEDGVKQSISTFSLVDLPGVTASTTSVMGVAPDVVTNASANDGRLYVIVLDDMEGEKDNAGIYQAKRTENVKAIARDFVEHHLGDVDQAALMTTSGRKDMTVQFTNDKRRLLESINRFQGGFGQVTETCAPAPNPFAPCVMVRDNIHVVMESLEAVAGWLSTMSGRRKGIVLVTERLGRSPTRTPGTLTDDLNVGLAAREAQDVAEFLQAASRGNVSLFAIDSVGVPGGRPGNVQPLPADPDDTAVFDEFRIQSLVTLAESTGGFAGVHTNNYAEVFDRVAEESGSYYLLGYSSTNPSQDGKPRKIRIEVRKPMLKVRARSGYTPPKPGDRPATTTSGLPATLEELVKSPLPVSGLSLTVAAAPFRSSTGGSVGVVVEARPGQLQPIEQNGRAGSIELAIVVSDKDGKQVGGERGTLTIPSQGTADAIASRGVRLLSSLDLKPGEYHLSVAATLPGAGNPGGSVRYDLTMPNFSVPLAMSGVAIGSIDASRVLTRGADARWKQSLGMPPTAARTFKRSDEIRVFAEIYDNDLRRDHTTTVTTTIQTARPPTSGDVAVPTVGPIYQTSAGTPVQNAEGVMFSKRETLPRLGGETTFPTVTSIALSNLEPGDFLLTIEAVSSLEANRPIVKQIPFTVTSER